MRLFGESFRCVHVSRVSVARGSWRTVQSHSSRVLRATFYHSSVTRPNSETSLRGAASFVGAFAFLAFALGYETYRGPQNFISETKTDGEAAGILIPYHEVQKHACPEDCWVIINGCIYDVTDFLQLHPGGTQAILREAGKDVTQMFSMLHPPGVLDTLPPESLIGHVDPDTLPMGIEGASSEADLRRQANREAIPSAENMLLLQDFENWAEKILSDVAWAYYRSAADEENTFHENRDAYRRYFFRPRILRDMSEGSTETTIIGIPSALPIFMAPAAMAKLGHPLGEVNFTKAAGEFGIIQMISSNASCGLQEMFDVRKQNQPLIFQLYLNKDRSASEALIQRVDKLGARAIVLTVDVCWESKRTLDVRAKASANPLPSSPSNQKKASAGVAQAIGGYQDRNLTWADISFIRRNTKLPIIIKGVQCLEDVQLCVDNGVEGVILSNHGGRQADYSPAPIDILYEIRSLRPDLFGKIEIMIDGGVRCGADVVKALALGAKAVGVGRPFLYANGTHGEEGAKRVIEILQEEITNTMRNIGANTIEDLRPEMVGPRGPWVENNRPSFAARIRRCS